MDELADQFDKNTEIPPLRGKRRLWFFLSFAIFILGTFYYLFFAVPADFSVGSVLRIKNGETLGEISKQLQDEHFIKNASVFKLFFSLFSGGASVKAGDYVFDKPLSLWELKKRLAEGIYGIAPLRATIPEGWTVKEIGFYFKNLGIFKAEEFYLSYADLEGWLFPDTYFFDADNITPEVVAQTMRANFESKITPEMMAEIKSQGKTLSQIIIMASLIEKEAADLNDRKIVSGILWKRIEIGMPLQVDASLTYAIGKNTFQLTDADLKIDSPYNTYAHYGLPPGAISNPGLDSIMAAIYPEDSPYLYYLSDKNGHIYFARTFDEHVQNKFKYLR
ncbi:MAG: endolytic transglycosylase MltG [Candidatus Niyogibacteria bacterium]|nr:endolytic transglycosylase MltG [Candidatus Niyogibacteria bacterium]